MGDKEGNCSREGGKGEGVHGHLGLVGVKDEGTSGAGTPGNIQAGAKMKLDCSVDESEHLHSKCSVGAHLLGIDHLVVTDVCHPAAHGLTDG